MKEGDEVTLTDYANRPGLPEYKGTVAKMWTRYVTIRFEHDGVASRFDFDLETGGQASGHQLGDRWLRIKGV